jgi:hypothetical protein
LILRRALTERNMQITSLNARDVVIELHKSTLQKHLMSDLSWIISFLMRKDNLDHPSYRHDLVV